MSRKEEDNDKEPEETKYEKGKDGGKGSKRDKGEGKNNSMQNNVKGTEDDMKKNGRRDRNTANSYNEKERVNGAITIAEERARI